LSNSKYSLLGRYRGIVQSISYEVILFLIFIIFSFIILIYNLNTIIIFQKDYVIIILYLFLFFFILYISFLAELNRSPLDLVEGESELVSGFNLEYIGGGFSLIFIGEYGIIVLRIVLFILIFFGKIEIFIGLIIVFSII
jgi:NADH-quinone oxidoreductase subunit H